MQATTYRGGDAASGPKKIADASAASRGRGGLGRRDTDDLYVMVKQPLGQTSEKSKTSKRRLFRGVMDRFDKPDNSNARDGSSGATEGGSLESFADAGLQWLSPGRSRKASDAGLQWLSPGRSRRGSKAIAADGSLEAAQVASSESVAEGGEAGDSAAGTAPTATQTKSARTKETPDRFSRFLGKMLGVKDDALPDRPIEVDERPVDGGGDALAAAPPNPRSAPGGASARGAGATELDAPGRRAQREEAVASTEAQSGDGTSADAASAASATDASGATAAAAATVPRETPHAEAVISATAVSAVATNDMPVAVAVALPVADGAAVLRSTDPAPRARRPSRTGRTHGTGGGRSSNSETAGVGTGEAVSISGWVANEEREHGGAVRVFSAQRVLEGRVQKRCRLAVSRKNMTQVIQDKEIVQRFTT